MTASTRTATRNELRQRIEAVLRGTLQTHEAVLAALDALDVLCAGPDSKLELREYIAARLIDLEPHTTLDDLVEIVWPLVAAVVPSESGAGDALSGKETPAMSRTASRDLGYGLTEEDRLRGWLISLPPEKYERARRGEWNGAGSAS